MATSTADMMEPPALITNGLVVVSVIFPVLSAAAVLLRLKARSIAAQPLLMDDWLIIVSWILTFGQSILIWVFANITGVETYKIDPAQGIEYSTMCLLILAAFVQLPLASVKLSILWFYKRIFHLRPFRVAVWSMIPLVFAWGVIFFVLVLTQANPISGGWTGQGYLRYNSFALGLAQVSSSIGLDVLILCFPLPVIFTLHMRAKRKIAIASIFWLGIFCCVAAAVRLWLVYTTTQAVINSHNSGYSAIYYQNENIIFAIIEPNCSVIAACMPCFGPFFRGGRTPESMVRSVRSLFSLRSNQSQRNAASHPTELNAIEQGRSQSSHTSDSRVKLRTGEDDWKSYPGVAATDSSVKTQGPNGEEFQGEGINVTRNVDVTSARGI